METTTEVLTEAEQQAAEMQQFWIAAGIILGIIIISAIVVGVIYSHHNQCWPFKYGGFTEKNGYRDVKYWHSNDKDD